ncbi:MAG: ribonuclease PH [Clostridia bacterium]|nr:ribonuclease PH [Clostridia bacterium]MBQ6960760.1 ribonuclease PH [Clostridia bacterium]
MSRPDNRKPNELRPCEITVDFVGTADGSCLIRCGGTRVICTASVDESVPPFLKGKNVGWLTAEYSMLPASTGRRKARDGVKKDGRGVEISRLIGRALRQAVDRRFLGERTITIDCDVLEADGGTRTASITGGFVALVCAVDKLLKQGKIKESPIVHQIAAVSAGIVDDVPCLDLCYLEDSAAQTDMNFVMDETGAFVELQGTGEGRAFSRGELNEILALGEKGIDELHEKQREALGDRTRHIAPKRTVVIASNNAHKIQEISHMLEDRLNVISMAQAGFTEEIDENGETFEENAAIKARAVAKATGLCALGDDSGLSVDALDGAPGVHSARYCGHHGDDKANNDLLIANMADIPAEDRTAEFVCAMALSLPNGDVKTVRGTCPGVITFTPRGTGGFGYDPYFEYLSGETFAEMAQEEKNQISHRANAMRLMLPYLEEL